MQSPEHESFLVENCSIPFCKGCGHTHVIRRLDEALVRLGLAPQDVCLVTDIGCIGLADGLFAEPHSVHTTHGRSTAFATGIALADAVLYNRKLKTVVLIGDGGAMIGLLHLVNAALMNVDVTVLLCNNFLFGMTGGQNSAMSPLDFVTPTTPSGNIIPPLDICQVIADSHGGFVSRHLATDRNLTETIADAIAYPGFSLVEIVELCTEHGTPRNELTGARLREVVEKHGQQFGTLSRREERQEFGSVYREKYVQQDAVTPQPAAASNGKHHSLKTPVGIVLAGSAGEKIQSTAHRFCQHAVDHGLYATQKNDNPVTQGSGFSLSEVILSPAEIHFTGIESPDVVIIVSADGLREATAQGVFKRLTPASLLLIDSELTAPASPARLESHAFRKHAGGKEAARMALEQYLRMTGILPVEKFS